MLGYWSFLTKIWIKIKMIFQTEMGGAVGPDAVQNRNFSHFRSEIDKLTKRLKGMERDTADWKEKFEASNDQVICQNTYVIVLEAEQNIFSSRWKDCSNMS